jgi:hypothetical protein
MKDAAKRAPAGMVAHALAITVILFIAGVVFYVR